MGGGEALNIAISALGGCIVAIGWWIGQTLTGLNEKMERVLIRLESHEAKLELLKAQKE